MYFDSSTLNAKELRVHIPGLGAAGGGAPVEFMLSMVFFSLTLSCVHRGEGVIYEAVPGCRDGIGTSSSMAYQLDIITDLRHVILNAHVSQFWNPKYIHSKNVGCNAEICKMEGGNINADMTLDIS